MNSYTLVAGILIIGIQCGFVATSTEDDTPARCFSGLLAIVLFVPIMGRSLGVW